jgi:hypothetical protein
MCTGILHEQTKLTKVGDVKLRGKQTSAGEMIVGRKEYEYIICFDSNSRHTTKKESTTHG